MKPFNPKHLVSIVLIIGAIISAIMSPTTNAWGWMLFCSMMIL